MFQNDWRHEYPHLHVKDQTTDLLSERDPVHISNKNNKRFKSLYECRKETVFNFYLCFYLITFNINVTYPHFHSNITFSRNSIISF
jgi:hypothetical protein